MYQSTNVNIPQFASSTTTTAQTEEPIFNHYDNFNDNPTLKASNDFEQLEQQERQQQLQPEHQLHQPTNGYTQVSSQNRNSGPTNDCFRMHDQSLNAFGQSNDTISIALDEIGEIIQRDLRDPLGSIGQPKSQPADHEQLNQSPFYEGLANNTNQGPERSSSKFQDALFSETKASIYENLKTIINDCDTSLASTSDISKMANMNNNNIKQQQQQHRNHQQSNNQTNVYNRPFNEFAGQDETSKPFVEIIEQPAKCALRFRYKCEGRSAGSLPGKNSTADSKTFPSIRINNYTGKAVVVISCVTKDAPYMAHPHNIVGKEGCKKGICTVVITNEANMIRSFPSLGIQCVKRKDIEESLTLRESIMVDPFRNGFAHKSCASNIDLNVVRLCFQVFIEGPTPNKCNIPLVPIVTEPIHDKKAMSDLVITKLSHCSAPATGGREVILLCDRIAKDDIQIRFFEEREGKLIWETFTDVAPNDVHKQVAICFRTPKYYNENIVQPVMVRIQLRRISDKQTSESRLFQFLPCESDEDVISRKRQKIEWVNMNHNVVGNIFQSPPILVQQQHHQQSHQQQQQQLQHHHQQHHHPQPHSSNQQPTHPVQQHHQHHQQQQQQHHHQRDSPDQIY